MEFRNRHMSFIPELLGLHRLNAHAVPPFAPHIQCPEPFRIHVLQRYGNCGYRRLRQSAVLQPPVQKTVRRVSYGVQKTIKAIRRSNICSDSSYARSMSVSEQNMHKTKSPVIYSGSISDLQLLFLNIQ